MTDQSIAVRILEERPVGYLVELLEKQSTMMVPKNTFIKRAELGVYDVQNMSFLAGKI
ncbi:MAG: hypothetical protein OEQ53_18940 [Saprospiraceae bacterium]|nr:hypothetical protein [Saprospiraceae bacterium]